MSSRLRSSALLAVMSVVVLSVLSGVASGSMASPGKHHAVPVLGSKAFPGSPDAIGFGTAHPTHVFNGGDPSGEAIHLHWTGWGKARTVAHGKTFVSRPKGGFYKHKGRLEFRASDLGHCSANGPLAYRHLHARVAAPGKSYGHWSRWSEANNICHPLS